MTGNRQGSSGDWSALVWHRRRLLGRRIGSRGIGRAAADDIPPRAGAVSRNVVNRLHSRYSLYAGRYLALLLAKRAICRLRRVARAGRSGAGKGYSSVGHRSGRKSGELSIDDMQTLGKQEQITMHHCIQGWSGVAAMGRTAAGALDRMVRPLPEAGAVVFHSFGEGHYGGAYYDTLTMQNACIPRRCWPTK